MEFNIIPCKKCGRLIDPTDWRTNNAIKDDSGYTHSQCPYSLLIEAMPTFDRMDHIEFRNKLSVYGEIVNFSMSHLSTENRVRVTATVEYQHRESVQNLFQSNKTQGLYKVTYLYPHNDTKPAYVYDIEKLSTFPPEHLAYLLVPNYKNNKTVFKQWMDIIRKDKAKVVEFIYHSKANDAHTLNHQGYIINIPNNLQHLLPPKTLPSIESHRESENDEPLTETELQKYPVIVVCSYIGAIERVLNENEKDILYIIPASTIKIVCKYYRMNMKFYVAFDGILREFDAENDEEKVISYIKAIDISRSMVVIRDVRISDVPNVKQVWPNGIDYCAVIGVSKCNRMNHLILSPQGRDDMLSIEEKFTTKEGYLPANVEYIYCGKEHGIIATDRSGLFQIKLEDIWSDKVNTMKCLSAGPKIWQKCNGITMCYLTGMDKVFIVQCQRSDERMKVFYEGYTLPKCSIFDLNTYEWNDVAPLSCIKWRSYVDISARPSLSYVTDYHHLNCNVVFNYHDRATVYHMTHFHLLSKYDLHKGEWLPLRGTEEDRCRHGVVRPCLWLDNDSKDVLYHACYIGKEIQIRNIDLREKGYHWKPYMNMEFPNDKGITIGTGYNSMRLFT